MTDWYDDDKFWESFQDYMFNPRRMAATVGEVDGMARMLELKRGSTVLDLCCGFGRHSLEFARRGMRVTGVDRTARYLEQARATAAKESLGVEFVLTDMREFIRPLAFDGAINFFTAFGYFDDPADDQRVAQNLFDSLKPGGRLIVDVNGKELLAAKFRARDWNRYADGRIVLEERRIIDGWKRIENRWILIDGATRREKTLTLRQYSGGELEALLLSVGFSEVALYGNLGGAPYDEKAERLIALAKK